jgi:methyl-accepting chemotaxis protein
MAWVLVLAGLGGGGFMGKLMYDMTRYVGGMAGEVASLAKDVGEMNQKVGVMADHMVRMDQNMERMADHIARMNENMDRMTGHMGRMDQTIHQGSETLQRWNPMDMVMPPGGGRQ